MVHHPSIIRFQNDSVMIHQSYIIGNRPQPNTTCHLPHAFCHLQSYSNPAKSILNLQCAACSLTLLMYSRPSLERHHHQPSHIKHPSSVIVHHQISTITISIIRHISPNITNISPISQNHHPLASIIHRPSIISTIASIINHHISIGTHRPSTVRHHISSSINHHPLPSSII